MRRQSHRRLRRTSTLVGVLSRLKDLRVGLAEVETSCKIKVCSSMRVSSFNFLL